MSFLPGKDTASFVATCQKVSKILPYEYCYFSSRGQSNLGVLINQRHLRYDMLLKMDIYKLEALLRNPTLESDLLRSVLSYFTEKKKQTMAYLVLDDPRLELDGILEFLRRRNCLLDDGSEILWVVEHHRMREVVKACGICEQKWSTEYSTCSNTTDCDEILCSKCVFRHKCRGCNLILCVQCQQHNGANKIQTCDSNYCTHYRCQTCQCEDFCQRCHNVRLCFVCTENVCSSCSESFQMMMT